MTRPENTTCRIIQIDGEPVRILGAPDWTDEDYTFMTAVIRAAKLRARGKA